MWFLNKDKGFAMAGVVNLHCDNGVSANELAICAEDRKYEIISADIPWNYNDKKMNRGGAARYYDTLTLEKVKAINVESVAADDCLLMLWATAPLLPEALQVIESWGFKYKTVGFVWVKRSSRFWEHVAKRARASFLEYAALYSDVEGLNPYSPSAAKAWFGAEWAKSLMGRVAYNIGMGSYTRANAEFVLFAVKGKGASLIEDRSISQIIDACKMEHSRKPDEYFEQVDKLVGDKSRFEMFARSRRKGWDVLGDQVDSDYYLDDSMQLQRFVSPTNQNRKPTTKPYVKPASLALPVN
jgi:N6-adenosine-specific RNA methylase IME4